MRFGPARPPERRTILRSRPRHAADGPVSSVLSGLRRDLIVRVAFNPEKAQDGRERRQPNRALAQTGRAQPVLVELDPVRQHVLDGLVHAGNKHPPDSRFAHRNRPGGFAPPDPPSPSLAGPPRPASAFAKATADAPKRLRRGKAAAPAAARRSAVGTRGASPAPGTPYPHPRRKRLAAGIQLRTASVRWL